MEDTGLKAFPICTQIEYFQGGYCKPCGDRSFAAYPQASMCYSCDSGHESIQYLCENILFSSNAEESDEEPIEVSVEEIEAQREFS